MVQIPTEISPAKQELTPYVSSLTARLMQSAASAGMRMDSTGLQLLAEVISFAASAEKRMGDQEARIQHLEGVAATDELTGVANRRGLKALLAEALAQAARHGDSGCLGFIDLDDFKLINDTYGHDAGDMALRHVAKLLGRCLRSGDHVARISGDEFAVVMTRSGRGDAAAQLRRLQRVINSSPFCFHGQTIQIGCSVGACDFRAGSDPAAVIRAADLAMYRNKAQRKNVPQTALC